MFVEGGRELPERDIFSNASLIEWLEGKDPDERYRYSSHCNCLLAQYFTAMGKQGVYVTNSQVWFDVKKHKPSRFGGYDLPYRWDHIAINGMTFGHALKLARKLLPVEATVEAGTPTSSPKLGLKDRVLGWLLAA